MAKIIKFPTPLTVAVAAVAAALPPAPKPAQDAAAPKVSDTPRNDRREPADGGPRTGTRVLGTAVRMLWTVCVLTWPFLKWALSLDVTFQFARMLWFWDVPGVHAGWTFLLHFAVLTGFTFFVSHYRPRSV